MDVYCQWCDEPYEVTVAYNNLGEDGGRSAEEAKEDFLSGVGCPACKWGTLGEKTDSFKSLAMGMMGDLVGDDMDGMASMLDDWDCVYGLD